ncbi:MAG: hypothetical protein J5662_05115 [Clostridia bacterium]|nr:hypothetical protein [Clostridia bacterium]
MKKLAVKAVSLIMLLALICCLFPASVFATSFENVPFESFAYWGSSEKAVPVKAMYSFEKELSGADFGLGDTLKAPLDIFFDDTYLYLLDSDSSRLIVYDEQQSQIVSLITKPLYKGEELNFRRAEGVFAKDGNIYICDTENARIIVCDINGTVSKVVGCPESDVIPEDFIFAPSKLVSDSKGFFYLISGGCFYGAMRFDSDFNFLGFYGANVTATSISDIYSNIVGKLFNNNEKISGQAKKIPFQFVDLCVDSYDFVYTVTNSGEYGQIRRINPGGSNVYQVLSDGVYSKSDSVFFGLRGSIKRTFETEKSSLISVTVDEDDFIYVFDSKFGRILIYDEFGVMLCAFGGGLGDGGNKGTFKKPASIHINGERLYALDSAKGTVSVFRITDYGKLIKKANILTNEGRYEESKEVWNEVLLNDSNCQSAYNGLAKAMLATDEYKEALKMARMGKNTELYGEAFIKVRGEFFDRYFYAVFIPAIALAAVISVLLIIKKKKGIVLIKDKTVVSAIGACVHPFTAYKNLYENKRKKTVIAVVFLFLFFFVTILLDFFKGYMYGYVDTASYNAFFTLLGTTGIALLYTVANWGICSIQGGKGKMYEVFIAVAYSLVPIIVYRLFLLIISNIMTEKEAFFLSVFEVLAWIITGFSLLVANMEIHEYDFFKVLKTTVIIILGMGLVIFLMFMVIVLIQQLITFLQTIFNELSLR